MKPIFSKSLKTTITSLSILAASTVLVACGGGGDSGPTPATTSSPLKAIDADPANQVKSLEDTSASVTQLQSNSSSLSAFTDSIEVKSIDQKAVTTDYVDCSTNALRNQCYGTATLTMNRPATRIANGIAPGTSFKVTMNQFRTTSQAASDAVTGTVAMDFPTGMTMQPKMNGTMAILVDTTAPAPATSIDLSFTADNLAVAGNAPNYRLTGGFSIVPKGDQTVTGKFNNWGTTPGVSQVGSSAVITQGLDSATITVESSSASSSIYAINYTVGGVAKPVMRVVRSVAGGKATYTKL